MKTASKLMPILALACLAVLPSCTSTSGTVKPWERGNLAKPIMAPDRDPLTGTISEHMWFTREAFAGGRGVGGGGCGCN